MADNRREYIMQFMVNADLNGNFKGTFSKAQQEFSRLGKEIQGLHRVQGDIASYQKQQGALDNTRGKLESLQKQHDLLQKEISETEGSTASLEREKVKLEQRIKDTETALERQNQKLDITGARLREAGVDALDLAQADARLTAQIHELEVQQEKAAEGAQSFGERTAAAFEAAEQAVAAAGVAAALKEAADGFAACVEGAGTLEEAMSTVEALSQANAQEMAALVAQAKELGATTKFTAKESADAMGYMAMAGWDAADMLQGMDGVLRLAAASGEDLAMVSDIVTDSLSAFGLTARDTARFSDVLAAAATSSNTNVAIMGETFKMSASVAGALGYRIEDVAVAMGLMANSGVKGSIAGTALRNTFDGLLEGVTLTSAAFGEYEYSAVKADGTMKDFGSTIDELRGYFEQMTEAERVNNAQAIAGQRGYNGLLAILNATDADYASLASSINNCTGAAQRMAGVRLDNLNGQLTLMNSAWDALTTTIGEQFIPEARGLAELGADIFSGLNDFIGANPALVRGVVAFTGVVGGAAVAITGVNAAMKVFQALNAASMFTNPVFLAAGAVGMLAAGVAALTAATDDSVPSVKELTEATREMREAAAEANGVYEQTASQALATAQAAETYIAKLEELGEGTEASNEHSRTYLNTLSLLCNAIPELAEYVNLETGAIEGGTEALRRQTDAWKKNAEAKAYQEYMNDLMGQYNEVMTESAANSIKLTEAEIKLEKIEQARETDLARLNELKNKGTALTSEEQAEYYRLEDALVGYNSEMLDAVDAVKTYTEAVEKDKEALAEAEAAVNDAQEAYERIKGATEDQTEAEAEAARQSEALQEVIGNTAERVAALSEAYNKAYGAALDSIQGQYDLWDKAADVAAVSAGDINKALESQASYWRDYNANLEFLNERASDIEGLRDVIASFADGSPDSVNAIAGISAALRTGNDKDVQAMVANWQELQREQASTSESMAALVTDFQSQMDEMGAALAEDIKAMDLSAEAMAAGRATIQGYIDAANDMLEPVRAAYEELGRTGTNAMRASFYNSIGYAPGKSVDTSLSPLPRMYASGTGNAPPGWAWVGEEGPELIRMQGGETVLPAEISQEFALLTAYKNEIAAYAGGTDNASAVMEEAARLTEISNSAYAAYNNATYNSASYQANTSKAVPAAVEAIPSPGGGFYGPIKVEVHIHLGENASPETVQALEDYVRRGELQEAVADAMENIQADAARGDYA